MERKTIKRIAALFLSVMLVACLLPLLGQTQAQAATTVKSISYQPISGVEIEEGTGGWFNEEEEFYDYNVYFKDGDQLIVNWSDGTSSTYTYVSDYSSDTFDEYFKCPGKASISADSIVIMDDQYDTHWKVGNTYPVTYTYQNKSCTVNYSIVENSVESIEYTPAKSELAEGVDGFEIETESGETQFMYDVYMCEGDQLKVNWTSGKTSTYKCAYEEYEEDGEWYIHSVFQYMGDEEFDDINDDEIEINDDQYEKPWGLGEHSITVWYNGRSTVVPFKVVEDTGLIFSDVERDNNFYEEINWMANVGLTTGYPDGTYRPWNSVNRAAVVTFIWRMEGEPEPSEIATFKDMPTNNEDFMKAISWASEEGITTGYSDGTFRPWADCNRAAIVTFLWRYQGKPSVPEKAEFKDLTKNSDFDAAISWASFEGITNGYADNTFRPWNDCHRAAMAAFLSRM